MKPIIQACYLPILDAYVGRRDIRASVLGFLIEPAPADVGGCYLVATDGHQMVVIHDSRAQSDETYLLDVPRRMLAECKPRTGKQMIFGDKFVEFDVAAGYASLIDVTGPIRGERCKRIDAKPIDWRRVSPLSKRRPADDVEINHSLLANIWRAISKSGISKKYASIRVELDESGKTFVYPCLPDDHRMFFVIMNMQGGAKGRDAKWIRDIEKRWEKPKPPVVLPEGFTPWSGGEMPVDGKNQCRLRYARRENWQQL